MPFAQNEMQSFCVRHVGERKPKAIPNEQKNTLNFISLLNKVNICSFFDDFKTIHSTMSVMPTRSQKKH